MMDEAEITPLINDEESSIHSTNDEESSTPSMPSIQNATLPLPSGFEYHLFVSCQTADANFAKQLIQDLETRFQFRCLYGDRDFEPGKKILTNVVESITKCMKFLVILTPSYLESGFCKEEMLQACTHFVRNNMDGCLVCLKLEDCDVPKEIADVTYIDGNAMTMKDISRRVLDAFQKSGTFILPRQHTNGMEILYSRVVKSNRSAWIGSRYRFGEITKTRNNCDEDGINLFRTVTDEINTFRWMRFLGCLCSKRLMCFLPIASFCLAMLGSFAEAFFYKENKPDSLSKAFGQAFFDFLLLIGCGCGLVTAASRSLDRFLRESIKYKTLCGTNYFVIRKQVVDQHSCCTPLAKYRHLLTLYLALIKYNTEPCQLFIQSKLTEICRMQKSDEEIKNVSDGFILEAIWEHYNDSQLTPKSGVPRHSTFNGVDCLCQLVESSPKYSKYVAGIKPEPIEC